VVVAAGAKEPKERVRTGDAHRIRRNVTLTTEQARKFYTLGGSLRPRAITDRKFDGNGI
jgi:hypothetical protein